jgi:16S rRNA (guanine527-N7)-methyltransferase
VQFEGELDRFLPPDLPERERLVVKAARHLELIQKANDYMNLTRITNPEEAAIKHVYDSVAPWTHFSSCTRILDAGTGAGFPGIPLSIVLPAARFTLAESTQKKARFVEQVAETLELQNVEVLPERAEELFSIQNYEVITARAVAPMHKLLELFGRALRRRARLLLYKGPDIDQDLAEAAAHGAHAEVVCRYELPAGMGLRTLIQVCLKPSHRATPRKQAAANPL